MVFVGFVGFFLLQVERIFAVLEEKNGADLPLGIFCLIFVLQVEFSFGFLLLSDFSVLVQFETSSVVRLLQVELVSALLFFLVLLLPLFFFSLSPFVAFYELLL